MLNRNTSMLLLVVLMVGTSSCVSKKTLLEAKIAAQYQQDSLQQILETSHETNDSLRLALAHQQGVSEGLYVTQDKLQDRLDILQLEIDQLGANASSTVQDLRARINDKDRAIAAREARLDAVAAVLTKRENRLAALETALREVGDQLSADDRSYRQNGGSLAMAIGEDVLFRQNSTSRLQEEGTDILDQLSDIVMTFPEMKILVVGHTDNRSVKREGLNNWQYSALRAVSIVEYLTDNTDLGANRLMAASRSEFEPLESNETSEGRARNRRIELVFTPDNALFLREIARALDN